MRYVVLIALAMGCVESSSDGGPTLTSGSIKKDIPIAINRDLDVLFVIDSSPAMASHAANVKANLEKFIDVMRAMKGFPEVHIGVTTMDLGGTDCTTNDDGKLRTANGLDGTFLVDVVDDGNAFRLRNYDGDIADVFARMTDVGTAGCSITQPLAAARRAFANPINRNFLRSNSFKAIFFITAGDAPDDGTSLAEYKAFFRGLVADPSTLFFGAAVGVANGRMKAFLDEFPNRSSHVAITSTDWTQMFTALTGYPKTSLGSPCIEGPLLDVHPSPGDQYECSVWYLFPQGAHRVPWCETSLAGPCWDIVEDPLQCPDFGDTENRLFEIEHALTDIPSGTHLDIECLSR